MAELDDEKLREAIGSRLACPVWPECGDDEGRCLACAEAGAIIAALKDRDRLRAVLAAAREMSALDIDYLMRNRQAAFDAADKLQDAIDVYDVAALEGRDG